MLDLDGERAARDTQHRRVEVGSDRRGVERGRHGDDVQRAVLTRASTQREGQVALQMPFVELVEDHRADAAQIGIAGEASQEDALGDEADARALRGALVEAHLVAHAFAHLLAELFGDEARGQTRGDATRLEDHDLSVDQIQERRRHACGLSRAWLGDDHHAATRTHGLAHFLQVRVDGQGLRSDHALTSAGSPRPRSR